MRAVKASETGPERRVRAACRALGLGYRLGGWGLPGRPDLAMPGRRYAVFVHGCFWHGHECRRGARLPKTNTAYWQAKVARNRTRDAAALQALAEIGWRSLVIWECETHDPADLEAKLDPLRR
jgi:DNA mismatch endonuclease (patch repair protein)